MKNTRSQEGDNRTSYYGSIKVFRHVIVHMPKTLQTQDAMGGLGGKCAKHISEQVCFDLNHLSFVYFVTTNINEKKYIFALFLVEQLDKNNFRADEMRASNSRNPKMKTGTLNF